MQNKKPRTTGGINGDNSKRVNPVYRLMEGERRGKIVGVIDYVKNFPRPSNRNLESEAGGAFTQSVKNYINKKRNK